MENTSLKLLRYWQHSLGYLLKATCFLLQVMWVLQKFVLVLDKGNILVAKGFEILLSVCVGDISIWFCFGGYQHMVLFWGVIAALPALIHARLHGCAGSSCPEQNHTANPNHMLIVNHL